MATRDASQDAVIANPAHSGRCVVYVGDSAGAVTTLGTIGGVADLYDPLLGVEATFSVDAHGTCTLRVKRQIGKWSFSPLCVGGGNLLQPTEARFAFGRRIQVFAIVTPPGAGPNTPASSFVWVFDGVIDSIAWPGDSIEIVCSDRTATMRDTFIERERMYGFCTGAWGGAEVWRYDIGALALNTIVVPSKLRQTGHWYYVSVAGSPSVVEPTWPTGAGATVVSGTCTFKEGGVTSLVGHPVETVMAQLRSDNPSTSVIPHPELYVPVASGWTIKPYVQGRMPLLKALEVFPEQLGWRLHMWWDQLDVVGAGDALWYLRFIVPDRARVTVDKIIPLDHETDCSDLSTNPWSMRNVIHVVYGDASSRDPGGQPVRITRIASDAASIAANGRRFMEIREDDASALDSAAEADQLAASVLADLKDPPIGLSVQIPSDPWVDVGDLVQVLADGIRYSTDQKLAARQVKHSWVELSARTDLTLIGKPVARHEGWLVKDTRLRGNDPHASILFDAETIAEVTGSVIGGVRVGHTATGSKQGLEPHFELHVSELAGFTASAATLKAIASGDSEARELTGLIPGKTYYRQTVPFSYNAMKKVRGSPSAEVSFEAGRGGAGHLEVGVDWGRKPLNGRFETWTEPTLIPDHWEMGSGNFSDSWTRATGDGLRFGSQCVQVLPKAGVLDPLRTRGFIPISGDTSFGMDWRVRCSAAGTGVAQLEYRARWYDRFQAFISETTLDTVTSASLTTGTWYNRRAKATSPSSARFVKLAFTPTAAGANDSEFQMAGAFINEARLLAPEIVGDTSIVGKLARGPSYFAPVVTDHVFENNAAGTVTQRRTEWSGDWMLDLDQQHVGGSHIQWNLRSKRPGPTWDELLSFRMGNVGVGTTAPGAKLDVAGTMLVSGAVQMTADIQATNLSHVRAAGVAATSMPNNTPTIVLFSPESYDTKGEYDPTTGRFTAAVAGYYHFSTNVLTASVAWAAGTLFYVVLYKNGGFFQGSGQTLYSAAITSNRSATLSGVVKLVAGDIIDIRGQHTQGGAVSVLNDGNWTWLQIDRIL